MLIRLFRSAGATGHVFFLKNGRIADKGLAYSGFIGPKTTVAVVPTTAQVLNFAIDAQTKDKQNVVVQGSLTATLTPSTAVSKFDFTVNAKDGGYSSQWNQVLHARVIERVLRAVLDKVKNLDVEEATRSQKEVEDAVTTALGNNAFEGDGITINSCSIPKIEPGDEDVENAIGATERQAMLTDADKALHDRRLKAAANERAVKEYEAGTKLELEKKQGILLVEQALNKEKEANADAKATEIRLAPLENVEAGKLLGAAIMDAAKTGRLGSLAITSEFLAAVGQK
ncbi:MAG: SPFH domain-containing protein [bacterium]|nr:SPFH domain-containing protein [bacterium]